MVQGLLLSNASPRRASKRGLPVLPKLRHRELEASSDDEYERVSVRDIQLVDPCPPALIVAAETPSLAAMAVELEETVLELTRPRRTPPPSGRPTVAWVATIFAASTVMSLTVPAAPVAVPVAALPPASPAARAVTRTREPIAVAVGKAPVAVVAVDPAEPAADPAPPSDPAPPADPAPLADAP